jgi:hypothetical protein
MLDQNHLKLELQFFEILAALTSWWQILFGAQAQD